MTLWGQRPGFCGPLRATAGGSGAMEGERSEFIPDKCFLPFQDHGLARVQPQTQCTITDRPERKGQTGRREREKKKHLEFRIQITVSIKETVTTEHTFQGQADP